MPLTQMSHFYQTTDTSNCQRQRDRLDVLMDLTYIIGGGTWSKVEGLRKIDNIQMMVYEFSNRRLYEK